MERKDGKKNGETMRIRMSIELFERIKMNKITSGWSEEADSSFARHLIILGLNELECIWGAKKKTKEDVNEQDEIEKKSNTFKKTG